MGEGDEPDSPQFPSAGIISDSRLGHIPEADLTQGMVPDSDSEILSPFSPDGEAHEPLEAINVDEDSHVQADNNRLGDSIDVETFEEANDVLGVDFQEGRILALPMLGALQAGFECCQHVSTLIYCCLNFQCFESTSNPSNRNHLYE